MSETTSVLVVGAGPVGLTLAAELHRHGVPCRIIDANEAPAPLAESRALGLQARTLEVFKDVGIAPEILGRARPLNGISGYSEGKRAIHLTFDLSDLDTEFPHIYTLPQGETERALRGRLESLGGRVERSTRLVGLSQDDEGVSATLADGSGAESTGRFAWVVGSDGARSAVRKALGLKFEGGEYEERFLLIDLDLRWPLPDDEATLLLTQDGQVVGFPLPDGRWRLIDTSGKIPGDDPAAILARFRDLVTGNGFPEAEFGAVSWTSAFRIHRRVVDRFRVGRVFVAGDAAHIHSPAGGQGMNTGIQDAYNLAWKLGLVHAGASPDSILDSFEAERRPVALGVLRGTDRLTRLATLRGPIARGVRDRLLAVLSEFDFVRRKLPREASELDVGYRSSPIVSEDVPGLFGSIAPGGPGLRDYLDFRHAPHPGDRAPDVEIGGDGPARLSDVLSGTKHVLLLFTSDPSGFAEVLRGPRTDRIKAFLVARDPAPDSPFEVLRDPDGHLRDRFGAGSSALYLIRPDGYIGYRGHPADPAKLSAYLDRIFGAK